MKQAESHLTYIRDFLKKVNTERKMRNVVGFYLNCIIFYKKLVLTEDEIKSDRSYSQKQPPYRGKKNRGKVTKFFASD